MAILGKWNERLPRQIFQSEFLISVGLIAVNQPQREALVPHQDAPSASFDHPQLAFHLNFLRLS